jgi:hypothetical protein
VLDGRNRARACIAAGVEPTYRPFTGEDPGAFVVSANIRRRHLTHEQKLELIEKLLSAHPNKSDRQIAETTKTDHKTVGKVRRAKVARGEIPHVETKTDTKGRQQPSKRGQSRTDRRQVEQEKEPSPDSEDDGDSQEVIWRRGLLYRAEEAAGNARYEDWSQFTADSEVVAAAERAAEAWEKTAAYLRELRPARLRLDTAEEAIDPFEIPPMLDRTKGAA